MALISSIAMSIDGRSEWTLKIRQVEGINNMCIYVRELHDYKIKRRKKPTTYLVGI